MKKLLLTMSLLCVANLGVAQESTPCWDCTLGIYDTNMLLQNFGIWDTAVTPNKTFYFGIRYAPGSGYDGLTYIEFSIEGLPTTFLPPTFNILNGGIRTGSTIATPADTTDAGAEGGWGVVWQVCQPGNLVLIEMTFVSFDPVPNDVVMRVHRQFRPNDVSLPNTLFTTCEFPIFPKVRVGEGCYVINPTVGVGESVGTPPCVLIGPTAVDQATWSTVKALYR